MTQIIWQNHQMMTLWWIISKLYAQNICMSIYIYIGILRKWQIILDITLKLLEVEFIFYSYFHSLVSQESVQEYCNLTKIRHQFFSCKLQPNENYPWIMMSIPKCVRNTLHQVFTIYFSLAELCDLEVINLVKVHGLRQSKWAIF